MHKVPFFIRFAAHTKNRMLKRVALVATWMFMWQVMQLSYTPVYAQADTTTGQQSDSVRNANITLQLSRLQQLQAEHLSDSIKRSMLEQELRMLKMSDAGKKDILQKELQQLRGQDSVRMARQRKNIDSLRQFVKGYPVVFHRDTLFFLYNRQGSFSARDRAAAVAQRVESLSEIYSFTLDSLHIDSAETTADVVYRDNLVISLSDNDALWERTDKITLASRYQAAIGMAIATYRQQTSVTELVKEVLLALLVILTAAVVIFALQKLFYRLQLRIRRHQGTKIKGVKIRNYEVLTAGRSVNLLLTVLNLVKWLLVLVVVYFALPLLFGIFPWTKDYSQLLLGYVLQPVKKILLAIWNYVPNFITVVILLIIFRYIIKGLRFLKNEIEKGVLQIPGFYTDWANPTFQIIRVLILAFLLIVIFPYMPGADSPVFKGVSVFLGVLFTFSSAGALGNIMAGLVLTYMRAFKIGDRVKIGEVTGDIVEKSLLATRIRTTKNEIISLPNAMVMNNYTVNYSDEAEAKGLIVHTTVTVGYDVPADQARRLLLEAAARMPLIEKEPPPFVLHLHLNDFNVAYEINGYTKHAGRQQFIYSELNRHVQEVFGEAGIELLSPHYQNVQYQKGNS
jgi:small-conductance mechanosensitive channel